MEGMQTEVVQTEAVAAGPLRLSTHLDDVLLYSSTIFNHCRCFVFSQPMGMVGDTKQKTTKVNYARAVALFDEFLGLKQLPTYEQITTQQLKEHLKIDTMRQFARFLVDYKSQGQGEHFARDTVKQHLSGIKVLLCRAFGDKCFEENDPEGIERMSEWHNRGASDWYSVLRKWAEDEITRRCILTGRVGIPLVGVMYYCVLYYVSSGSCSVCVCMSWYVLFFVQNLFSASF